MSAYTDDRPYSIDLVGAVGDSPLGSGCKVSFTPGTGGTTGCVHRQDARPRLDSSGVLRQQGGRGDIETLYRTVPCVSRVLLMA